MRLNWICGVLFGIALTIPASAQIGVYIGTPPPPLRYEQRGPIPGPGYVWIEGYWAPDGHHLPVGGRALGASVLRRSILVSSSLRSLS
jgi:hypothetical protein